MKFKSTAMVVTERKRSGFESPTNGMIYEHHRYSRHSKTGAYSMHSRHSVSDVCITYKRGHSEFGFMCSECFQLKFAKSNTSVDINIFDDTAPNFISFEPTVNIRYFAKKCPFCNTADAEFIKLDPHIANVVTSLNQKGYFTMFSCEGHMMDNTCKSTYIIFESNDLLDYESFLPLSWGVDWEYYKTWGRVAIYAHHEVDQYGNLYNIEPIEELEEFVKQLPTARSIEGSIYWSLLQ